MFVVNMDTIGRTLCSPPLLNRNKTTCNKTKMFVEFVRLTFKKRGGEQDCTIDHNQSGDL